MRTLTYEELKTLYTTHGYPFDTQVNAVNIFGIRNSENKVDEFNDIIGVGVVQERFVEDPPTKQSIILQHAATTDPGSAFLNESMMNPEGTACLIPGFYRDCWMLGKHNGKYDALVQAKMGVFKVWRDKNKDGKLDMAGPVYSDVTGLDQHTTNFLTDAQKVGPYSAGCQVNQLHIDFLEQMDYYKMHFTFISKFVSYALFTEDQLPNA